MTLIDPASTHYYQRPDTWLLQRRGLPSLYRNLTLKGLA